MERDLQVEERRMAEVCGEMMLTARIWLPFHLLLLSATLAGVVLRGWGWPVAAVMSGVTLWLLYLQVRLSLDARLFQRFHHGELLPEELDRVLEAFGLKRADRGGVSMEQRCRGARRCYLRLLAATVVQVALFVVLCGIEGF